MSQPLYRRIVHGYCEQIFDEFGNCLSQEFVALEAQPVERRYIAPEGPAEDNQTLEDDELIEHPEDLKEIESVEKNWPYDMVQPKLMKPKMPVSAAAK